MQGYWKLPSNVNYVNDKGFYNGVEGYEYGNYLNNEKTGVWIVNDTNGNLIAHRVYVNDTTEFEIQYKNGKIFSVTTTKIGPIQKRGETNIREALEMEIISFNKRGKIRGKVIWRKREG